MRAAFRKRDADGAKHDVIERVLVVAIILVAGLAFGLWLGTVIAAKYAALSSAF